MKAAAVLLALDEAASLDSSNKKHDGRSFAFFTFIYTYIYTRRLRTVDRLFEGRGGLLESLSGGKKFSS